MALEKSKEIYNALPQFMKDVIQKHLTLAVEEEFENAKKRIEERKAEIITGVVLYIQKQVQFQSMEDKLIITVRTQ